MKANETMDQIIERIAKAAVVAAERSHKYDLAEEVVKRAGKLSVWLVSRIESRARDIAAVK